VSIPRMTDRCFLLLLALLALLPRVGLNLTLSAEDFLKIDGRDYQRIAHHLAAGHGFAIGSYRWFEPIPPDPPDRHPDFARPPLLPAVGAVLYGLPGDWTIWARVVSILLGVGLVLGVQRLARSLLGVGVGRLAGAFFAVYPVAIFYGAHWSTESLFALCLVLGVFSLVRLRASGDRRFAALAALCFGVATLARPTGLVYLVGMLPLVVIGSGRRRRFQHFALYALVGCAVLTPWTVRNFRLTGVPNPLTFFGSYNAWLGMNEGMYRMYRAGEHPEFLVHMQKLYEEDLKQHVGRMEEEGCFAPIAQARYWRREARSFIRSNPEKAIYILGKRLVHFFRPWPNRASVSPWVSWIAVLSTVPVFALVMIGLIAHPPARSPYLLVPCILALVAAMPFVFHIRFRFPMFEPFAVILAAAGAVALGAGLSALRAGRSRSPLPVRRQAQ